MSSSEVWHVVTRTATRYRRQVFSCTLSSENSFVLRLGVVPARLSASPYIGEEISEVSTRHVDVIAEAVPARGSARRRVGVDSGTTRRTRLLCVKTGRCRCRNISFVLEFHCLCDIGPSSLLPKEKMAAVVIQLCEHGTLVFGLTWQNYRQNLEAWSKKNLCHELGLV